MRSKKHSWDFVRHGQKAIQVAAVGAGAFLIANHGIADSLIPEAVQQTFELKTDNDSTLCTLLTQIVNLPAPETVNFRFSIATSNNTKNLFSVFTVDVGDFVFRGGVPASVKPVKLSSANISSGNSSTNGIYNVSVLDDGGIMGSTRDLNAGAALLAMIMSGNLNVTFQRNGDLTTRTYTVTDRPSSDEVHKFSACVARLVGTK